MVTLMPLCAHAAEALPGIAAIALDRTVVPAGGTIQATYTFLARGPTPRRCVVFVHVRSPEGDAPGIGADFTPELPTICWPADGLVREGPLPISIPETTAPGTYRLLIGAYEPGAGRLAFSNADLHDGMGRYQVAEVQVVGKGETPEPQPLARAFVPVDEARLFAVRGTRPQTARARREAPAQPLVLRSEALEVTLDLADGLPYQYRLPGGGVLFGEAHGTRATANLLRQADRAERIVELVPATRRTGNSPGGIDVSFAAAFDGTPAVDLALRYSLGGPTLAISLEDVAEHPGFELLQVNLLSLATLWQGDAPAWLAYPEGGGQLVAVGKAREGRVRWTTDWAFAMPVAMVGNAQVTAVLEVPSYLDTTEVAVDDGAARCTTLGTTKAFRVPGGRPTPDLLVNEGSLCRVRVLPSSPQSPWLDAAHLLAEGLPARPTSYYDNRFVYKVLCDMPGGKEFQTFDQVADLLRRLAALTDNWPQVAYLVGWQYTGHDTGYPAVDKVNERLGGYDGLMRLMDEGRKLNGTVSLHDNYDDAYTESPAWDESVIARSPDGSAMRGGIWAGGQSYIIGMAAYMRGPGPERVRYTVERYRIRDTYHIDVLSAAPLRHDWNPGHPASAVDNLHAKWAVLEAFAARGVDVTSEGLSWPFVGRMSYFWNSPRRQAERFGGEEPIPLISALLRTSAAWGGLNGEGAGVLESIFYNAAFSQDLFGGPASLDLAVDSFYLVQVPWFSLHTRPLTGFARDGSRVHLEFGEGTFADLDWNGLRYAVTVDGVEIARDGATFCRLDDRRIALYSRAPQTLATPLPAGWDAATLEATALHGDGHREVVPLIHEGGRLRVPVAARRPVIIRRP